MNKKMKKDIIAATTVLVATLAMSIIGYLALTSTLQLWETFFQYLAQGQNVGLGLLSLAIWQSVGLQSFVPFLALYGCYVIAHMVFNQADLRAVRLKIFWFGVLSLALGALMLIIPTQQYAFLTVLIFIVPGLLALFLAIEKPTTDIPVQTVSGPHNYRSNKQVVQTKLPYRRYHQK